MQIFDEKKKRIGTLSGYKEMAITTSIDTGDKELTFRYPSNGTYAKHLREEAYIRTKEDEFVIKGIEKGEQFNNYTAVLNVEELEGKVFPQGFESKEKTIKECLEDAFDGTGWHVRTSTVEKRRTIREQEETTAWNVLKRSLSTYRCECIIDSLKKEIEIHERIGTDKGCYFIEGLNIRKVELKSDTYDFFTRIYPIGRDGLTPESVLGKPYIDNFQYSNKIKATVWKDERYTKVESLIEDAVAKLEEMSKPYKEFTVEVADLAKVSKKYKDILSYKIGDTVTIVSKKTKTREKHRIVKITEYPKTPEKNTVEIANSKKTFAEVQQEEIEAETIRATVEEEKLGEDIEKNTEDIEEINENLGDLNIRLEKTDEGLLAEVTRAEGAEKSLGSRISLTEEGILTEATRAKEAEEDLSGRIEVLPGDVELNVSNGEDSASISLTITKEDGTVVITKAKTIKFTGNVIFASDLTDGTTEISGDNIKTGTISADRIDTETLVAKKGEFKEFSSSVMSIHPTLGNGYAIYREILNVDEHLRLRCRGYWRAQNGGIYNGDTHIDVYPYKVNIVTFGGATGQGGVLQVNGTNVVMTSDLSDYATKNWVNNQGFSKGSVDLSSYLTKSSASDTYMPKSGGTFSGEVEFNTKPQCNANFNLGPNYIQYNNKNGLIGYEGSCGQIGIPSSGINVLRGNPKLGSSSGPAVTSDERLKYDFGSLESYEEFFMDLKPLSYKYKAGTTGRKHIGFGAKAILDNLEKHNIPTNDFGGYIESPVFICEDETEEYKKAYEDAGLQNGDMERSLRYEEFIALNTHMIQRNSKRIDELTSLLREKGVI